MSPNRKSSAKTFRVIGVRANGERIAISKHASRGVADRIVELVGQGSDFTQILIEPEPNGGIENDPGASVHGE